MRQVKFQQLEFYAFIHFTVWQSWANICKRHFRKICLRVPSLLLTEGLYPLFGRIITTTIILRKKGRATAEFTAKWNSPVTVGNIVLKENILCGQRVESFTVEAERNGEFTEIYSGTVIGYKRIVPLKNLHTTAIRIKITDSRTEPTLAFLGIYKGE